MLVQLNKKIEIIKEDGIFQIPEDLKKQIQEFWKEQIKENPYLFNGETWNVVKKEETENAIKLYIQKTDYAHYLFDERVGIEGKYSCYNLHAGILLETKDNYYIVGEMSETTSYPKGLQISGGNVDKNDITLEGKINIEGAIARELKEELNIELYDKKIVEEYHIQYMEIPEGKRHSYGPIMKGKINISAQEMQKRYNNYKEQLEQKGEQAEFSKLYFIPKEQALQFLKNLENPKRPYLESLIELDSKK